MSDIIDSNTVHFPLISSELHRKENDNIMLYCIFGLDLPPRVSSSFKLQLQWVFHAGCVALLSFGPVDNLPNALDITSLVVEILNNHISKGNDAEFVI